MGGNIGGGSGGDTGGGSGGAPGGDTGGGSGRVRGVGGGVGLPGPSVSSSPRLVLPFCWEVRGRGGGGTSQR